MTRLGSVYAFSSELEAWSQSRRLRLEEKEERAEAPSRRWVKRSTSAPTRTSRARLWLVLAGVAVFVLTAVTSVMLRVRAGHTIQPKITSLAVLPLNNLSGDPTQEYLADEMTEELCGRLARIHDLRVISRTSVMRFKDTKLSVPEIARTLGVDALVEGSVIRQGSRIRVHAQLIRGSTDEHLWSDEYDGELGDALLSRARWHNPSRAEWRSRSPERSMPRLSRRIMSRPKFTRAILKPKMNSAQ